MKKIYLTFALVIGLVSLQAQTISAGFLYGANTSTFGGASANDFSLTTGDRFGVMLNFAPIENFSIEPQFLVSNKGAIIQTAGSDLRLDLTYAELPILFNIRIPLGGVLYPKVFAGPYFSTRVGGPSSFELPYTENEEIVVDQVDITKNDVGATFGLGVDFVLERFYLGADARADYGINRIGSGELTPDLKNRSYSLNFILGFVLEN